MAEMHPVLWRRITDRRLRHPHVKVDWQRKWRNGNGFASAVAIGARAR